MRVSPHLYTKKYKKEGFGYAATVSQVYTQEREMQVIRTVAGFHVTPDTSFGEWYKQLQLVFVICGCERGR